MAITMQKNWTMREWNYFEGALCRRTAGECVPHPHPLGWKTEMGIGIGNTLVVMLQWPARAQNLILCAKLIALHRN